jgi:catechol 2,3-dioxygenase-like lactoylglutathione lyase family enzyme
MNNPGTDKSRRLNYRSGRVRNCTLILALALLFVIAPNVQAGNDAAETDEQLLVSVLSRMTILVKDVDVSKRFYTYALGYEVLLDKDISRQSVLELMGLGPEQRVRFAILESSHIIEGIRREGAGLGLIQVSNPSPPVMSRPEGAMLASGESMMAVRTSDIETVYQRLQELGARIVIEPITTTDGSETELVVHDPDGVRIHVVQRPDQDGK